MRAVLIECALVMAVVAIAAPGVIWWAKIAWELIP